MNFDKYYAKLKKSVTKAVTYCMIPFIWSVQKKQVYRDRKQISVCLGLGRLGGNRIHDLGVWVSRKYSMTVVMDTKYCKIYNNHWIGHLKWLNCQLGLKKRNSIIASWIFKNKNARSSRNPISQRFFKRVSKSPWCKE